MALRVEIITVTPFQQNCSLIWCDKTQIGAVVDPGGDIDKIIQAIDHFKVQVSKILLTHGHLDHAGGAHDLAEALKVKIIGPHKEDLFWLEGIEKQGQSYGFSGAKVCYPDEWLEGGEEVSVGDEKLTVLFCPGHTPGHVVFYHAASKLAFVGDVLFKGSIGRTDFPRGDFDTLINSITTQLWPLGKETRFVSGHGGISDFASERLSNPYVSDAKLGISS
ncbi:MBL fold metallo-hydrolase [Aliikangiella marina]|uniref:MBL fold metallo-hydrolase n=1 Tax=Aliikangiella marina TaxID=1712262 RepID=A0A545TI64_9GAMM|nr:MBL fold metallo-hydrolase [Aliikangiella marina]TQV76898.1 MBL fold metallo-hydrolase [Aliikangiella marina]